MPRKRIIYATAEEVLEILLNEPSKYKALLCQRTRTLSHYNDLEQYYILDQGIQMFQASKRLNNIEL
ncbi:hypothetical protein [Vibrio diazotrophicus]|uniref:hypothetical protein n=1 Tax=Vibrio diazotrophicus TaxID=685 RepID=UPI00142D8E09|nr:hypothetical protein [Vibrio diazotrophicus]NIY94580.1 hypothetical protein [Vibrio diazotrophicus]